ncbi:transposase [Nocardia carnea]|uniref:transposase n=1 Tax=Nocardia carnea TaxID=37328 RepID=UPI0024550566|nr:transposase [Nocardia carnea]
MERIEDRSRAINRLRALLTEYFPALDATFAFARSTSALILVSKYQTPTAIRDAGEDAIALWLRGRGARFFRKAAARAVEAAQSQTVHIPGEQLAAGIIGQLAHDILELNDAITEVNHDIETHYSRHRYAPIISSLPGFGPVLGAEFLAFTGGNMNLYPSAGHLASFCGLAPVAKDSGNITGNHRRPRSYDRRLLRVWYLSSMTALTVDGPSKTYYDRKRTEGKHHVQAILSLSRRRANVLWAMLRDNTPYNPIRTSRRSPRR